VKLLAIILLGITLAGSSDAGALPGSLTPHTGTPEERDGLQRVLWLDFGNTRRVPHHAVGIRADCCMPGVMWARGHVRDVERNRDRGALLGDFLEGFESTLIIDVDSLVEYTGILTLGDADTSRGPVTIFADGIELIRDLETEAGEFVDLSFSFSSGAGRLSVHFVTEGCASFAVNGLALYRKKEEDQVAWTQWGARYSKPPKFKPDVGGNPLFLQSHSTPAVSAEETLRGYCEYLLENRSSDGSFSYRGLWYENSFAVRTLLAGGDLLDEERYTEAALHNLDRFVAEQQPDGNWSAMYFGRPDCPQAGEFISDPMTTNLADLGTMAFCVAYAARRVDGERSRIYLEAARRYADEIVLPNQLESGAFPNLKYEGRSFLSAYTVATAVQASFLAALSQATGDSTYLEHAERAGMFLASNIDTSGTVVFHAFDRRQASVVSPGVLGDLFYVIDGLLWVRYATHQGPVRLAIDITLRDYVSGSQGLLTRIEEEAWWYTENAWEGSKKAAILYLLNTMDAFEIVDVGDLSSRVLALYQDSTLRPFGILGDTLNPDQGEYGLPATSLAGLGAASMIDPLVAFGPPRR
jgi:hypothetical protein